MMKKETICKSGKRLFSDPIYFYIVAIAGIIFLHIAVHDYVRWLYADYLIFPALMFLGAALERKAAWKSKWNLVLPALMAAWFLLLQGKRILVNEEIQNVGLFLFVYLFAFPLASLLQDGNEKKALKIFAGVYLAAAATLVVDTALLLTDCVPSFFVRHIFWNGARLQVFWHSNIAACFLMTGIVFCTTFFADVSALWAKVALIILAVLMLGVMTLTNCRTIIILTGGYLGAQIFFALVKRKVKWLVPGMLIVLVVTVGFFIGAKSQYQINEAALIEQQMQTGVDADEVKLESASPQGTLLEDLGTLNNRTGIWAAAHRAIRENPEILLWGTTEPGAYVSDYHSYDIGHLHNAWVECLLALGCVGFLLALLFTVVTLWNCLIILLKDHQNIWKRNVALLALCLMGASVLEPYLFYTTFEYHLVDVLFFLCAGYLVHWQEADNRRMLMAIRSKLSTKKK